MNRPQRYDENGIPVFTAENTFREGEGVYIHMSTDFPDFVGVRHKHEFIEIVYVISGNAEHETAGGRYPVSKGDVVIVRCQSTFEDGDTVLVFLGGHAACRRLRRTEGGMLFIASNPDYEPVFFPENASADKKCRILGRVVELRAKY